MKLIVCVDDNWGMAFGGRRQSRDTLQRRHLMKLVREKKLYMSPYSAKLFCKAAKKPDPLPENIIVSEDYLSEAGEGDFAFAELEDITSRRERTEALLVYHWGRLYPSDLRIAAEYRKEFVPVYSESFRGSSHDRIVFEEYKRCEKA